MIKAAEAEAAEAAEEESAARIPPEDLIGVKVRLVEPATAEGTLRRDGVIVAFQVGTLLGFGSSKHTVQWYEGGVACGKSKLTLRRNGNNGRRFRVIDGPPNEEGVLLSLVRMSSCKDTDLDLSALMMEVKVLVTGRLRRVMQLFPSATHSDLCEALLMYSPESALFAKGHQSSELVTNEQWAKYQGKLSYGSDQAFHNGVDDILGDDVPETDAMSAMHDEIVENGNDGDRYNLWYIMHCVAVEQPIYDEKGNLRQEEGGEPKVLDQGNGGMQLRDFTSKVNQMLECEGSRKRVTDANVLAMRLYTASTFRQFNTALRNKGNGEFRAETTMQFRACVQNARKCALVMQAIKRAKKATFRGVTGYLGNEFNGDGMVSNHIHERSSIPLLIPPPAGHGFRVLLYVTQRTRSGRVRGHSSALCAVHCVVYSRLPGGRRLCAFALSWGSRGAVSTVHGLVFGNQARRFFHVHHIPGPQRIRLRLWPGPGYRCSGCSTLSI
jgi:hypothetical protein